MYIEEEKIDKEKWEYREIKHQREIEDLEYGVLLEISYGDEEFGINQYYLIFKRECIICDDFLYAQEEPICRLEDITGYYKLKEKNVN